MALVVSLSDSFIASSSMSDRYLSFEQLKLGDVFQKGVMRYAILDL